MSLWEGSESHRSAFGTEHLNQYFPAFGGQILRDAAVQNNVFFWDTDNCYGSQPTVAAGIKLLEREKVVVTSKTYANTQKEARESVMRILHDLDTPYLDFCLLHGVEDGQLGGKNAGAGRTEAHEGPRSHSADWPFHALPTGGLGCQRC